MVIDQNDILVSQISAQLQFCSVLFTNSSKEWIISIHRHTSAARVLQSLHGLHQMKFYHRCQEPANPLRERERERERERALSPVFI